MTPNAVEDCKTQSKKNITQDIFVVKKDGSREKFEIEKIHKVVSWATDGLTGVTVSDVEINAKLNIVDGITTEQIHSVLIDSAANLVNEDTPDYQYVAGRLLNYQLRKNVWGGKNPPKLLDLIKKNIKNGYYTPNLLEWYSVEEINKIDEYINHHQDLEYTYCSIKQLCDKYLVKNQINKELYETPQFRYMVVSMTIFRNYKGNQKIQLIKRAYNYFSKFKINLATPQLVGLGTNSNAFASCILIEMLDTTNSINATNNAIARATSAGAGLGVNFGRMRAINSPVKNGTIIHPGVVPFLKIAEANTKAWAKNSFRGGSATINFPIWHYEIENIVQLKNSTTGTHDSRVFNLDYVIGISKLFYERFLKNENFTLFSPDEVEGLYEAFGTPEFDDLYKKYENDKKIRLKHTVNAREFFSLLVKERLETGRIYIMNIDNVNEYGSWIDKINMTNLCLSGDTTVSISLNNNLMKISLKECVDLFNDGNEIGILSKDLEGQSVEFEKIINAALIKKNSDVLKIEDLESGKYLICTQDHKIYTKNRGYIKAKNLKEDDVLDLA